ncbi:endonuclease domain-containing protein [Dialister sp.]|jgi:very-short-patch-repair endonuclease|uniref:endonuclease domain-containing protein n=1 Tax=Dialister sp. TaxID=1955814 RepID=UPI003A5BABB5
MRICKNTNLKERARELRNHMTPQETLLWNACLKRLPVQIYRQYIIENYIVDFFCRKAKLVIEVDGLQHYSMEGMKYDERRSSRIEKYGILVLRFSNLDIDHNLKNVGQYIENIIWERMEHLDDESDE